MNCQTYAGRTRPVTLMTFLARMPWRVILLAAYVGVNLVLIPQKVRIDPSAVVDWQTFQALPEALATGSIYHTTGAAPFVWSPAAAWLMAAVVAVGYWPWVAAHVGALLFLRSWFWIALLLASYGFWFDTAHGNTLTFSFVAGVIALRGSRPAALAYLLLLVLVPRPLTVPLAVVLVWRDAWLRAPLAWMLVGQVVITLLSGYAGDWWHAVTVFASPAGVTIGPTAIIGGWWLLVGVPLGAWLVLRQLPGWSGLAVTPYVNPQYMLWPLLDVDPSAVAREWQAWRSRPERPD